ncbi:hypothetical protein RND71_026295 [Anisodus tanguticus]|uniref:Helicase C-terminal domain-containing protein n=1 Tax=Anisodus tanguticus TaxID=243964 RepID=A0AAE1V881_9SOLA|nr:hypothetical protein RND71_026295 [Anisodus tanguticus]
MINHLFPEEIEEFPGNPTRAIRSFFSDRWSDPWNFFFLFLVREEIRFMVERDGSAKAIVFSQFTSFLDLIHYSLQKSGISCVQLDGSMTMAARDSAITRFTEDPDCRIFLMSLKAGGVALNLTVASHVFLMDPWWNPAVERQVQDRIHRIGQYKPIRIVRFVIENTIEERILKLQEKKELVFEG